ncbi:hypothetical protein CYY_001917 [Polysphondylium violaceum]|uniref:Uncharacterized protein n=1 Tax=Polysphondylium violaceum TaxID=133409 RepID=A0A8J4PZC0_9MYCE|nr:hypothetical protein CYY_001917 [Polysphondylium violaceum]
MVKYFILLLCILFIHNLVLPTTATPTPTILKENEGTIIDSSNDVKVIIIMAFKRVNDFKECLKSIVSANHYQDYHLIITQSVAMGDKTHFNQIDQVVQSMIDDGSSAFKSISHIETDSSTTLPYGNAYFAFKNLIKGLEYSFKVFPNVQTPIVFEEDVEVSKDIFEFFEKSSEIIKSNSKEIKFATSAFFLHTTHPQYDWRLDKPIKRKSVRNDLSLSLLNPNQLVQVKFNGQVEFKVLSWMLHKSAAHQMIKDFKEIQQWVIDNKYQDKIENKVNTPKPDLLIKNSDSWNHDRYLELRFKDLYFIGSQSPRCNHIPVGGHGLSSVIDDYGFPINQKYTKKNEFTMNLKINGDKGIWGSVKEYLPSFECPNRINCYNNQTNEKCGSVYVSTCLNIYGLECVPCSGRPASSLEPICHQRFNSCCKDNCSAHTPFFISIPSLFDSDDNASPDHTHK